MNREKAIQNEIDDAIFNFTIGESEKASQQLESLVEEHPEISSAWHALAEIFLSIGKTLQESFRSRGKSLGLRT